jgi:hypothetical protein
VCPRDAILFRDQAVRPIEGDRSPQASADLVNPGHLEQ